MRFSHEIANGCSVDLPPSTTQNTSFDWNSGKLSPSSPPTCYDNRAHWSDLQPPWQANDGFSPLSCVYRLEELVWQISFTHTEDRDQQKEEQILNQRPQATFPYWAFPTPPPGWAAATGWQELGGKWLAASSPGARPLNDSLKEL